MRTISDHGFLRSPEGVLSLVLDVISFDEANEPVLLVSRDENTAYLRRSEGDVHEIGNINQEIIGDVRAAKVIVVLEILGNDVTHTYGVPTAILEDTDDDEAPPDNS